MNTSIRKEKGPDGGFLNQAPLTYSPVQFNKKKLPLLLEKNGKRRTPPSFAFWSNADTKALSNAEALRDMEAIAIAEEIESLLKENVLYEGRRLRPSDIAILVAKRFHADKVIEQLRKRGIRTLRSSNENVLCSKEAHELKSVLEAMYDPERYASCGAAQATRIFGDSLNDLLNNDAASAHRRFATGEFSENLRKERESSLQSLTFCRRQNRRAFTAIRRRTRPHELSAHLGASASAAQHHR